MNYWPRWISAIKKRTATLSLAEMGAYDRLLDHYYAEEQPLPTDLDECCRIASALTKDERKAVAKVLSKFFVLTARGYANERADEEVSIALRKIDAAKANGAKGGRPMGSSKKPSGLFAGLAAGNPDGTHDEPAAKAPHQHHQKHHAGGVDSAASAGAQPGSDFAEGAFDEPAIVGNAAPTPYGAISRALRQAGISNAQPSLMRFRMLVDAGAQQSEFLGFVDKALGIQGDRFAYIVGAVEGERKRALATAGQLHRGPMPNRQEAIEQRNRAVGDQWLAEQGAAA